MIKIVIPTLKKCQIHHSIYFISVKVDENFLRLESFRRKTLIMIFQNVTKDDNCWHIFHHKLQNSLQLYFKITMI